MRWSNHLQELLVHIELNIDTFWAFSLSINGWYSYCFIVDQRSLHINCGGGTVQITNSSRRITYQADNIEVLAATNLHIERWGISNTGDFTDDTSDDDTFIISTSLRTSGGSPDLYKTARRSALSLVYYAFCLENGAYNVKLHFMEIQFSDKEVYSRIGRRIFDVYVQVKRHY